MDFQNVLLNILNNLKDMEEEEESIEDDFNDFIQGEEKQLYKGRASSLKELKEQYAARFPINCCKNKWDQNNGASIMCLECSLMDNSALCPECFANGNHEGHHAFIHKGSYGCCDCGDVTAIKKENFCSKHSHSVSSGDHLTEEEKKLFTNIFTEIGEVCFDADDSWFNRALTWITSFTEFGDEVMSCIVDAIIPYITTDLLIGKAKTSIREINSFLISISKFQNTTDILFPRLMDDFVKFRKSVSSIFNYIFVVFDLPSIMKYVEINPHWSTKIEEWIDVEMDHFCGSSLEIIDELNSLLLSMNIFCKVSNDSEEKRKAACEYAKFLRRIEKLCVIKRVFGDKYDRPELSPAIKVMFLMNNQEKLSDNFAKYVTVTDILEIMVDDLKTIDGSKCPAEEDVESNCSLLLYEFLAKVIKNKGESCIEELKEFGRKEFGDVATFAKKLVEMPMRFYSLLYYTEARKFVRNDENEITAILLNGKLEYGLIHTIHIFSLIQICCGMMDKEEFVQIAIEHFSVDKDEMEISLFHFLSCVILDRYSLLNDFEIAQKAGVFFHLIEKPCAIKDLLENIDKNDINTIDLLRKITTRVSQNEIATTVKYYTEVFDTYFIPWMLSGKTLTMVDKYMKTNKLMFVPAPANVYETEAYKCLNLTELFESPSFNSILIDIIQANTVCSQTYALSVLVLEYQYNIMAKSPKINIKSMMDLNGPKTTLKEAIKGMGKIGDKAFKMMCLEVETKEEDDSEKKKMMRKKKMMEIKKQFESQQNEFLLNDEEISDSDNEEQICPVCQLNDDDVWVYPLSLFKGPSPTFVSVNRAKSCMHKIHLHCIKMCNECPLDREEFRSFMPDLIDIEEVTPKIEDAIKEAFSNYSDPASVILSIIFNELYVLLARFNINKLCFKRYSKLMLRNMFLILKHYLTVFDKDKEFPKFTRELRNMINSNDYSPLVKLINLITEDMLMSCRITALFKYYCLGEFSNEKIDFEKFLSVENMRNIFSDVSTTINDTYVGKPFKETFDIKLPKSFVEFALPPFNINLSCKDIQLLSLLDGKVYNIASLLFSDYQLGIFVSGPMFGGLVLIKGGAMKYLQQIYLNMYGEIDIGNKIGMVTYLHEEIIPSVIDEFLNFI